MKGTNMIEINYETLQTALQEYFNKHLVEKPVVRDIIVSGCTWHTASKMQVIVVENGAFLEGRQ